MCLDSKFDFDEHIKGVQYFIKQVNLLVLLASSEIFYRDHLFCKSIILPQKQSPRGKFCEFLKSNFFTEHLRTTASVAYGDIIYDKAFLQGLFNRNLNPLNIKHLQLSHEEPLERKLILSYVQNHYKIDVGTENFVLFIKY